MSSACVCHTDEWCFYCNMFTPLEKKLELAVKENERLRNYLETLRSNTPYGLYQQQITEVLQDAQEYPCTCGNCDGEHFGMAIRRVET